MGVTISFDANAVKSQLQNVIERKVESLRNNKDLYMTLSQIWKDYLKGSGYLPYDTGALSNEDVRSKGNAVLREGRIFVNSKGIVFDPIEHHTYTRGGRLHEVGDEEDIHYAQFDAVREGIRNANQEAQADYGIWGAFVRDATPYIAEAMQKA